MTESNPLHGDPFCAVARAIEQDGRRTESGSVTGVLAAIPVLIAGVGVGVAVGLPSGPAAPVTGSVAGAATVAALTAGIYYLHEGVHDMIDNRQNRDPAVAPVDMTCKQYLSAAAMHRIRRTEQVSDSGEFHYDGSSLQKILRANPQVLDAILATPYHSDPMNVSAPMEEKRLRGFAVDNAPRPMTRSEQNWGSYEMPSLKH